MRVLRAAREWWMPLVAGGSVVAIIVLFLLLIPALGRISDQANRGNQAKARQCATLPASTKVYRDARRRDVITGHDLRVFYLSAPKGCAGKP